jgi:glycosyltransferase involved in cell wall biosynthesis
MPVWLRRIDWGLLLLETRPNKGGSMPTKLGEMFAAGVRPVQLGCNDEVRDWVVRTGSGITLPDASDDSLREAAAKIAGARDDRALLRRAREIAQPHFALSAGVDRYERLLRDVIARARR